MENRYLSVKKQFEAGRDEKNAAKMAAYMKGLFPFYGLPAPKRKAVYRELLRAEKKKAAVDWAFLDQCWADAHREFQYLVIDYLAAMQSCLTYEDVSSRLFTYVKTKQWWDTIDGLDRIIGNIAFTDGRIDDLMLEWAADGDLWVRRLAIDHQLCRKEKTNTALLESILIRNFGSSEFFINKAIGWSLRDYSKSDPGWVREFLRKYQSKMSPLSIREASKYLKTEP